MSLVAKAQSILSEYDSQTAIGKFAQSVLDYFESQLKQTSDPDSPFTLVKISKNEGATQTNFEYKGDFNESPRVGQSFRFYYDDRVITTSIVTEVIVSTSENKVEIKTLNSVYILSMG